jgi:hypothetical protein
MVLDPDDLACSRCGGIEFEVRRGASFRVGDVVLTTPTMETLRCAACEFETVDVDTGLALLDLLLRFASAEENHE